MENQKDFENGSIFQLLMRLAIPAILAQLVNALYNIVDRIYIGHIPGVGSAALTGVGLTFPIIIIISAFASMVGMGGAPLASIKMGEKNNEGAEKILGNAISLLVVFGILVTALFLAFKGPFLQMFGVGADSFRYADSYITIYICGSIFVMFSLGLNPFINTQGFAKTGMLTVLIGAVINIVLDPVFIFVFHLGVRGAAIATVISQAVSAAWVLKFLTGKKTVLKVRRANLKLNSKIVGSVCALGFAPFIMQSTESLLQITFNKNLALHGGELYVGVMTIISSLSQVLLMPLTGLTQGAQPILGYNYGANRIDRVKKTEHLLIGLCFGFSVLSWTLCMFTPSLLIGIFSSDAALMEIGVPMFQIYYCMFFLMGLQIACQQSFIALGQAKISVFLALLRKIILLIPLILIMAPIWGTTGIFAAEPVADTLAVLTTCISFIIFIRKVYSGKISRQ